MIAATRPNATLSNIDQTIERGKVREASSTSSAVVARYKYRIVRRSHWKHGYLHIWMALSKPSKQTNAELSPTIKDTPSVGQPPLFANCVNAASALFREAKIHSRITIAGSPRMWSTKRILSMTGSFLAKNVLKKTQNAAIPMISNVPCQSLYT